MPMHLRTLLIPFVLPALLAAAEPQAMQVLGLGAWV